ncbi:TVP38/TMEM64 family protein [uncultured Clostridium sp.]|jgi:uncharacterized membrane protein YdjX (TVP38/TMEM64 family)|uniref:TVP38/TMEM64 family protein n=1 Tax=uncultured Clostridium sp. TaxID=59620 RepID=UPI00262C721C|nr:TVP38/TMEM64 family protein [uncultured Clostridium sp.]
MKNKKKIVISLIIAIILILVFIGYKENINLAKVITAENMKRYVLSFGVLGPLIVILICILAAVTIVIPSFLVVFATTSIYGWEYSAMITWVGYTIGAGVCFLIARYLGRDVIKKISSKGKLSKLDNFLGNEGFKSILIARLLPFVPYEWTSYLAGVTSMSFKDFILGTAIGQIPGTIAFAALGEFFTGSLKYAFIGMMVLISVILIIGMVKKKYYK